MYEEGGEREEQTDEVDRGREKTVRGKNQTTTKK